MADFEKLDNVIKELEEQSIELKEFNKLYSEIGKLKSDITDNFSLLKKQSEEVSVVSSNIKSFVDTSKKQIDELYQDNKSFQKELDSSLIVRLDKHKSDIQIEIRNEGSQQQRAFENTLNTNFNNIDAKLKEQFLIMEKKIRVLTYMNLFFSVLVILLSVYILIN
jgi:protein subunit release factor A